MVLVCPLVGAQNLVANPYFDTGLDSWDAYMPGNGILLWSDNMDAGGSAVLGSASVGVFGGPFISFGIRQCVPVEAGEHYRFGASYHVAIDAGTAGWCISTISWFEGPGCTGNEPEGAGGNGITTTGSWLVSVNEDAEAVPTAVSAELQLIARKTTGDGMVSAFIDRAFFERTSIFADGFESGGTGAWS
jgi:hypothetical protein